MQLTNTYKGYTISYNGSYYQILLEDTIQTERPKTLDACIEWIDKKTKETFKRTKVIVVQWDSIKEAEATSLVENKAWVVYEDGKRELIGTNHLKELTEENKQLIEKFKELSKQAEEFTKEARKVKESLTKFDVSMMIVERNED